MTVLTKPSGFIKKPLINELPLEDKTICDEEKIDIHQNQEWTNNYSLRGMLCLSLIFLALLGFSGGVMICRGIMKPTTIRRYQGYCSIPMSSDMKEQMLMPLSVPNSRWGADDVQMVSADERDGIADALREELDIGDTVEKISVVNNGRRVHFIHDFSDNTTGIVDSDRCYVMELSPEVVLSPQVFISGLTTGVPFDVSRVRSSLHAALPELAELQRAAGEIAARCAARPMYRLYNDDRAIRKRSVPGNLAHDFIQFSGKHVQEIKINNLQEILEYENKTKA